MRRSRYKAALCPYCGADLTDEVHVLATTDGEERECTRCGGRLVYKVVTSYRVFKNRLPRSGEGSDS